MNLFIHHVDVITENMEATRSFYQDKFGMLIAGRFFSEGLFEFMFLRDCVASSTFSMEFCGRPLLSWQEDWLQKKGPGLDHLCFVTKDVESWYKKLQAERVEFIQHPEPVLGMQEFYFRDPMGIILEVLTSGEPALTSLELPPKKLVHGKPFHLQSTTILCHDPQSLVEFYTNVLGLTMVENPNGNNRDQFQLTDLLVASDPLRKGPFLDIKGPHCLTDRERELLKRKGAGIYQITFEVPNLESVFDTFIQEGISIKRELTGDKKSWRGILQDPNGVEIILS